MDFKSALTKVCHDFSKDIIFQRRIISILDDYVAFKDVPYYKLFYKTILNIGDMAQLISQNPNERAKAIYTFLAVSGLDESKVKAFLTLVSGCYYGKTSLSNDHSSNIKKEIIKKEGEGNPPPTRLQCPKLNTGSQKIQFLGIDLGENLDSFVNEMNRRGAKIKPGNASKTFRMQNFLSFSNAKIELFTYDFSPIVKTIVITFSNHGSRSELDRIHKVILGLYTEKYCMPNGYNGIWQAGNSKIEIKCNHFWEDGVWGNVKIKYSYSDPELLKLDIIEKQKKDAVLLAEKKKKKEEELRIKKQREEREQKRKQMLYKQSLDDI